MSSGVDNDFLRELVDLLAPKSMLVILDIDEEAMGRAAARGGLAASAAAAAGGGGASAAASKLALLDLIREIFESCRNIKVLACPPAGPDRPGHMRCAFLTLHFLHLLS